MRQCPRPARPLAEEEWERLRGERDWRAEGEQLLGRHGAAATVIVWIAGATVAAVWAATWLTR